MSNIDIAPSPESKNGDVVSVMNSRNAREFGRYFAASLVALCVDTGTLTFCTSVLGIPYLISGALAFLLGLVVVYVLSIYWVFEKRGVHNKMVEFGIFLVIGGVGFFINEGALWLLTSFFGFYYLISKAVSVLIVFTWNFLARKGLLFR